jgi:hypothetical protein
VNAARQKQRAANALPRANVVFIEPCLLRLDDRK